MSTSISVGDIKERYKLGERDFPKLQLRRVELRGAILRGINLQGSDLSYADLRDTDLSNANLSHCYFNEANLTNAKLNGANLKGAYLIKAYLTKANLNKANLEDSYLTAAFLTKATLMKANLSGAILQNAQIGGAYLKRAIYSHSTRFGIGFDPEKMGMEKISTLNVITTRKITIQNLLIHLEKIAKLTSNYLGPSITDKYLESSRPDIEWLQNFNVEGNSHISFNGPVSNNVTSIQLKWFEKWETAFIKSCSFILQDLPNMIEENNLGIDHIGENTAA